MRKSNKWQTVGVAATTAVSLLAAGGIVWQASYAAFSASTSNSNNSWSSGSVVITNDQSGGAVFTITGARPDASATALTPPASGGFTASDPKSGGSACIKVTYGGSLDADVRLRVARTEGGSDGGLSQYILFSIDTGTSSGTVADPTCADYTTGTTYLHGSANNSNTYLSTVPTTYTGGLTGWNPASQNTTKWYRLSWLIPANVADAAQSESVTATFTWEARNV